MSDEIRERIETLDSDSYNEALELAIQILDRCDRMKFWRQVSILFLILLAAIAVLTPYGWALVAINGAWTASYLWVSYKETLRDKESLSRVIGIVSKYSYTETNGVRRTLLTLKYMWVDIRNSKI